MFCKNCGKEIDENDKLCLLCGERQTENEEQVSEGILRLKRKRSLADIAVGYKIIIDGNEVDEIKQGNEKFFNLSYGTHILQLKLHWCVSRSIYFTIDSLHKDVQFECYTAFYGLFAVLTGFLIRKKYITLKRI